MQKTKRQKPNGEKDSRRFADHVVRSSTNRTQPALQAQYKNEVLFEVKSEFFEILIQAIGDTEEERPFFSRGVGWPTII